MIIDSSALIAVLRGEPEEAAFQTKLEVPQDNHISAGTLIETRMMAISLNVCVAHVYAYRVAVGSCHWQRTSNRRADVERRRRRSARSRAPQMSMFRASSTRTAHWNGMAHPVSRKTARSTCEGPRGRLAPTRLLQRIPWSEMRPRRH